ncbi:hypothetical protein PIB30_055911, partial [Stylosanthes scabra]|nr:hypothetical protein [Stylosanthes scabra]
MVKLKSIDTFFKRSDQTSAATPSTHKPLNTNGSSSTLQQQASSKRQRISFEEMDAFHLERDPGLRPMIWNFPPSLKDEIRRAYLK